MPIVIYSLQDQDASNVIKYIQILYVYTQSIHTLDVSGYQVEGSKSSWLWEKGCKVKWPTPKECFDLGVAGRSRLMLLEMCRNIDFLNDWLESMVMAVQHATVGGDNCNPPNILDNQREVLQLIYSTKGALQQSAAAAAKGDLDGATEERLDFWLRELELDQLNAHDAMRERLVGEGWKYFFSSANLPQFALASSASGYSQKVADLLLEMADFDPALVAVGPCGGFWQGLLSLPGADLKSCDALLTVLKLLLTFTACFLVGWLGIRVQSGHFVPAFNATPAGTVAYLIFQGGDQAAALKKNMDRFIGVAAGTTLGTLAVGTCASLQSLIGSDGATVIFLMLYFVFEATALFVYFSSPHFFYVGLMFSCFYAIASLRPFDALRVLPEPLGVRDERTSDSQDILSQLLAIVIATLMDLLADKSLSIRATANLQSFVQIVDEAFDKYPVSTRAKPLQLRKEGLGYLRAAAADGLEAAREPRCLGVPWRQELWNRVMKICHETWQCLTIVSTIENPSTDQEKSLRQSVEVLLRSSSFKKDGQCETKTVER